ncbi:MAG: hypothetical protein PVH03_14110 [Chloroflexota bacterium]|jgi:pimeloyl-ACP methyl ester carboxylesterase
MRATNRRAHVVGLSLGDYTALVLMENHAGVLDRVVMSGITAAPMPNRALLPVQLWLMSFLMKRRWFVNLQAKPGLGHGWNVEAPDLFNAMVRAWIVDTPLPYRLQAADNGDSL